MRDFLKPILVNDVTDADQVDVLGGDLDFKIALVHAQLEVCSLFTTDGARHDLFDRGCAVVRVDDRRDRFRTTWKDSWMLAWIARSILPVPDEYPRDSMKSLTLHALEDGTNLSSSTTTIRPCLRPRSRSHGQI